MWTVVGLNFRKNCSCPDKNPDLKCPTEVPSNLLRWFTEPLKHSFFLTLVVYANEEDYLLSHLFWNCKIFCSCLEKRDNLKLQLFSVSTCIFIICFYGACGLMLQVTFKQIKLLLYCHRGTKVSQTTHMLETYKWCNWSDFS